MRAARWVFLVFQLVWLNAIMPGHTRGAIPLPGSSPSCEGGHSCCAGRSQAGKKAPTPDEKRRCAICYFAAGLSLPPVVLLDHVVLGLVALLPLPPPVRPVFQAPPTPYDALAPPLV
jgi:hypothetical protein